MPGAGRRGIMTCRASRPVQREVAGYRVAAVVVDDLLDHHELGRIVVVRHRPRLWLAVGDSARALVRVLSRVALGAGLRDVVEPASGSPSVPGRLSAREDHRALVRPATSIVKSPASAFPPLSLITCLITVSCRPLVVVGHRAGLRLADRDVPVAVRGVARRVAGRAASR